MKTNLKFEYDCFLWDGKNKDEVKAFLVPFLNLRIEVIRRGFLYLELDNGRYWETAARINPGFWVCIGADNKLIVLSQNEFQKRSE